MDAFVKAGDTFSIVASRDIVDVRGIKLWGKGQPVSVALHQRLLDRKLREPIEACLEAKDGVTTARLHEELTAYLNSDTALARVIQPHAKTLLAEVKLLPIHSVVQLLLTTALATRPSTLPHAVSAMALAGAIALGQRAVHLDTRMAMLGGLLHDIGEVYIKPEYLDYSASLGVVGHKHLMVHPRVAQMLIRNMTDYPENLSRAIGEHHERLDGSGYPARLSANGLSTLGCLLAVVEATLGVARSNYTPLTRTSFALRVVPGEFDSLWTAMLCNAANTASSEEEAAMRPLAPADSQVPNQIEEHLAHALSLRDLLSQQGKGKDTLAIVDTVIARLRRLQVAWNALGFWGADKADLSQKELFQLDMAHKELEQRIRQLQRESLLLSERLGELEQTSLQSLWNGLLEEQMPNPPSTHNRV